MKNVIEVKGATLAEIKKALNDWINLYSENFSSKLIFNIHNAGRKHQIIVVDQKLDSEHFFYLLNYLKFPLGLEYNIEIKGNTKANNVDEKINNQELLVYISEKENEFDNVYAVTESLQYYKIDFGGNVNPVIDNESFININTENLKTPHTLSTNTNNVKSSNIEKSNTQIDKRFRIILYIFLILNSVYLLLPYLTQNPRTIIQTTFLISLGMFGWFILDERMLQLNHYYKKCILISTTYLFLGVTFERMNNFEFSNFPLFMFGVPLMFLLIQFPTRLLYLKIFNREPKIDKHGKFADMIYTLIVGFSPIILTIIIYDYIH